MEASLLFVIPSEAEDLQFHSPSNHPMQASPPFVIPSEAEGPAVLRTFHGNFFLRGAQPVQSPYRALGLARVRPT